MISFRSFGLSPQRNAIATSKRKSTEPMTAPVMSRPIRWLPTSDSPMITLASPHTTMPMPIWTSANP